MRLECSIKENQICDDPIDHKPYTEYKIEVIFNNEKIWMISQKYKAFCHLHENLVNQYPGIQFP